MELFPNLDKKINNLFEFEKGGERTKMNGDECDVYCVECVCEVLFFVIFMQASFVFV